MVFEHLISVYITGGCRDHFSALRIRRDHSSALNVRSDYSSALSIRRDHFSVLVILRDRLNALSICRDHSSALSILRDHFSALSVHLLTGSEDFSRVTSSEYPVTHSGSEATTYRIQSRSVGQIVTVIRLSACQQC